MNCKTLTWKATRGTTFNLDKDAETNVESNLPPGVKHGIAKYFGRQGVSVKISLLTRGIS